jgi:hypothetical protein
MTAGPFGNALVLTGSTGSGKTRGAPPLELLHRHLARATENVHATDGGRPVIPPASKILPWDGSPERSTATGTAPESRPPGPTALPGA